MLRIDCRHAQISRKQQHGRDADPRTHHCAALEYDSYDGDEPACTDGLHSCAEPCADSGRHLFVQREGRVESWCRRRDDDSLWRPSLHPRAIYNVEEKWQNQL